MNFFDIYPELDNLSSFTHPKYNKAYGFLSPSGLLELSNNLVTKIVDMRINNVIVLESGAAPLARICQIMAQKQGNNINWVYVKIPRNIEDYLPQTLQYYRSGLLPEIRSLGKGVESFFA